MENRLVIEFNGRKYQLKVVGLSKVGIRYPSFFGSIQLYDITKRDTKSKLKRLLDSVLGKELVATSKHASLGSIDSRYLSRAVASLSKSIENCLNYSEFLEGEFYRDIQKSVDDLVRRLK